MRSINLYRKYLSIYVLCCFFICEVSVNETKCQDYKNVLFEKKENNNIYKIYYTSKVFERSENVKMFIYKNYVRAEEPVAVEVDTDVTEGVRTATVSVDDSVVSVLAYFTNGKKIDNNDGLGYWTSINQEGKPKAGALASIAYMYAGAWDADNFKINKDARLAKALYEREFSNNSFLLRAYYRWFLNTFDLSDSEQEKEFELHLAKFAALTDLNEWEVLAISKYYAKLENRQLEDKYNKYLFEKYGNGCWATQMKTMPLQRLFSTTTDLSEKRKVYEQFKEQGYEVNNQCIRRYTELRKGITMLSKLIQYYVQEGELNNWLKEVNDLSDEFKYPTLLFGAKSLNDTGNYTLAETIAKPAIKWVKDHIDSPERNEAERLFYTNQEVKKAREKKYAEFLDIYANSLRRQKKYKESISSYEEAVVRSDGNNEMVNHNLIETLIELGDSLQSEDCIDRLSKSVIGGQLIRQQYIDLTEKNVKPSNANLFTDDSVRRMLQKSTLRSMPELKIIDTNGFSLDFKKYQNKILFIDFWASWCAPCIAGLEATRELMHKYENSDDVAFLIVNTMERSDRSVADAIIKNQLVDMKNFLDYKNTSVSILGISSLPTTIVVGKNRNIVLIDKGVEESVSRQVVKMAAVIDFLNKD